jgi:type IV secretory pathway VirJ component
MAVGRSRLPRIVSGLLLALLLIVVALLTVGGYFESEPFTLHWPPRRVPRYPLVAVYWSGDMGMRMSRSRGIVESLKAKGIPVLSVSSPALFGRARDRAFVDRAVATSVRAALTRSGAKRVAVVGSAFGAGIVGSGLGHIEPELRHRIASVVLVVPRTGVYFHANPTGIFYRGPVASDPEHTLPLLHGLPVTCIFRAEEDDSLCHETVMEGTRRVAIDEGRPQLADVVAAAVLDPPEPMH